MARCGQHVPRVSGHATRNRFLSQTRPSTAELYALRCCSMDLKDAPSLVHFRELHFLPRVIFTLGGIFLVGSFFVKSFILGLFGVGVTLAACALNLFLNSLRAYDIAAPLEIPWVLLFQLVIALSRVRNSQRFVRSLSLWRGAALA